jgi:hypothetical protein
VPSTSATSVASALRTDPRGGIIVPLVLGPVQRTERSFDVVPASLIVQPPPDELRDEGAAPSSPDAAIQVSHEFVV